MRVPNWWATILLSLAAFRVWRLVAEDDLTDRARRYVTRLGSSWHKEGDPIPAGYRLRLMKFLLCPWCMGAYCAFGFWIAWEAWPHGTLIAATPLALSVLLVGAERLMRG